MGSLEKRRGKTLIDGKIYFDHDRDVAMRQEIQNERQRLIQKMLADESKDKLTTPGDPGQAFDH